MITNWWYEGRDDSTARSAVKALIKEKDYKAIDVGAGILFWSYPECKYVADILTLPNFKVAGQEDVTPFTLNLQDRNTWTELLSYVAQNGKFDYSICSHTLEDIYNPSEVIDLLQTISHRGFIATPSKFEEMTYLYGAYYRGNPHHKFIFTVKNGRLQILPKSSFIENNPMSDTLAARYAEGVQLSVYWEGDIPYDLFTFRPITGGNQLIQEYYNALLDETNP
jgi:hypothetical protein